MDNNEIIKGFDSLAEGKKNLRLYMYLVVWFSAGVILVVLIWAFSVVTSAQGKVLVIDKGGEYMKTVVEDKQKLFFSLLNNHCALTAYYTNSFDRHTINQNQAKAAFLASKDNLNRIFAMYKDQRAYGDVLDRGIIYKCEFQQLENYNIDNEPYKVTFTSVLTITDEYTTKKILITSSGEIVRISPQYPENISGFYFKNYTQTYQNIVEENKNE